MFKDKLRATRECREISQTQMANMLGIAVTTYRNYENTLREPNYDTLVKISNVLGVSIDYLLENSDYKNTTNDISLKIKNLSPSSLEKLNDYIEYLIYKEKNRVLK